MEPLKVWRETVVIPTYETGSQDVHPMFLENRVYQGATGAVYPYGVTDTLSDSKTEKAWQAVWLENDYLKIMILPELGGRVQKAFDKVKQRDFVYHNEVIKPALVGLLGPWISGDIEFNWPQHHRPTTYMPVDCTFEEHEDGSKTVWVGETEPMHGLQVMTGFTLRPDRAALEIGSRVYNGNATPRHFLWWANPAVKGGDDHQSVFDCSGNAAGRLLALQSTADWGRVVYIGETGKVEFELSADLMHHQRRIIGSWVTSLFHMEKCAHDLTDWKLWPRNAITHRFSLEQAGDAYALMASGKCGKVVINFPE